MAVSVFPAPSTGSVPLTFSGRGTVSTNIPAGTYKYTCNGNVTLGGQLIEPGSGLVSFTNPVTSGTFGGTGLSFASATGQISPGGSSIGAMALSGDGSRILIGRSSSLGISTDNVSWFQGNTSVGIQAIGTVNADILVGQGAQLAWSTNNGTSWANANFSTGSLIREGIKRSSSAWLAVLNRAGSAEVCVLTNTGTNSSFSTRSTAASSVTWNTPYSLAIGPDRAVVAINNWTSGISGRVTWHSSGNTAFENWIRFTTGSNEDYTNGVFYVSALDRWYGFSGNASTFWYAPQSTAFSNNWTAGSLPNNAGGAAPRKIISGNGVYLMLLSSGQFAYRSTDGLNWTRVTISSTSLSNLDEGVFFNGKFIVGATQVSAPTFSSSDGITWQQDSLFNNNITAAVSDGTNHLVADSGGFIGFFNGTSWTFSQPNIGTNINDLAFANGTYVAVGVGGAIFTSPNGISWTNRAIDSNNNMGVAFGNGVWVVVDNVGRIKTTALDSGMTFTERTAVGSTAQFQGVVFTGSQFIAIANGSGTADSNYWWSRTGATSNWSNAAFSAAVQSASGFYLPKMLVERKFRYINNRFFVSGQSFDTQATRWASTERGFSIVPKMTPRSIPGEYGDGVYVSGNGHSVEFGVDPTNMSSVHSAVNANIGAISVGNGIVFAGYSGGSLARYDITGNSTITLEKVA